MKKVVLVFGIISGIISSVLMAASMASLNASGGCSENGMLIGYASMLLAFSLIFVAVKTFRDKHNAGIISFKTAFLIGLYISLITSTMYVITWAIEFHFFMPDFMDRYAAAAVEAARAAGKSEKEIAKKAAEMATMTKDYANPIFFSMYTYLEILPVGILVSLICAAILKRKEQKPGAAVSA